MSHNWVPIYGSVEINNGEIKFIPVPRPPSADGQPPLAPHAFIRSNIPFEQGVVEWEACLPDSESTCQISINTPTQAEFFSGLNVLGAPFGFATVSFAGTWEGKGGAGQGSILTPNQWYALKLHVHGSNIDLYVNQVKVLSTTATTSRGTLSLFMQSKGSVIVRNIRVQDEAPICFVVMQFSSEFDSLYTDVIKPVCEQNGYKVVRADDFYNCGMIIDDVTRSIRECAVIIADVTPDNANVYYELGFAHGIGKLTILLCDRSREKLPFDISGFRTIFYENTIAGKKQVEDRLEQHLSNLVQDAPSSPLPMPTKPLPNPQY